MVEHACSPLPYVSFIIVARNAAAQVRRLLNDYLAQDYSPSRRELIFVDGVSEDGTVNVVQKFVQDHPELKVAILENPKQTLAPGWNLAIKSARGEIVCRVDAHASIPTDYLSRGVSVLLAQEKNGVVCVGGPMLTQGEGPWGRWIAAVLSSPFGVGNSPFRYDRPPGYVDTVPFGFYWKWVFDEVGLFREDLDRNQDMELHARIRARGWKFYLSPELKTTYFSRGTLAGFLRQAFDNGYWVMRTWRQSRWRHLVPFAFVGGLAGLGLASLLWSWARACLFALAVLYGGLAFLFAGKTAHRQGNCKYLLTMPPLFFLLHFTYGLGSWRGLLSRQKGGSAPIYSWFHPGHLFMMQDREREVLKVLKTNGFDRLENKKILEVGCGAGYWLTDFLKWGARAENLTGLDLSPERLAQARNRCPRKVTLVLGDAAHLGFTDGSFDLVLQSTMFTSVLQKAGKQPIAAEMLRVLKKDGLILWYDFYVNNPRNPNVRGVTKAEIHALFPHCQISLHRITLAPPLARFLAPYSFLLCHLLAKVPLLCTHYLGVIRKMK